MWFLVWPSLHPCTFFGKCFLYVFVILKVEFFSDSSKQMIKQSRCCCMHDMEIIVGGPSCVMLGGPSCPTCRPRASWRLMAMIAWMHLSSVPKCLGIVHHPYPTSTRTLTLPHPSSNGKSCRRGFARSALTCYVREIVPRCPTHST